MQRATRNRMPALRERFTNRIGRKSRRSKGDLAGQSLSKWALKRKV